jgi:hypothetical protein
MTTTRQISAYDFGSVTGKHGDEYRFGLMKESAASALRELAEQIDAGLVILQEACIETTAKNDDFVLSKLTIGYVHKGPHSAL